MATKPIDLRIGGAMTSGGKQGSPHCVRSTDWFGVARRGFRVRPGRGAGTRSPARVQYPARRNTQPDPDIRSVAEAPVRCALTGGRMRCPREAGVPRSAGETAAGMMSCRIERHVRIRPTAHRRDWPGERWGAMSTWVLGGRFTRHNRPMRVRGLFETH